MSPHRPATPACEMGEPHSNVPLVDLGKFEAIAVPRDHPLVGLVSRDERRFEKLHEAFRVAHILGRAASFAVDERGVVDVDLAIAQLFDDDSVLPVVTEVVDVLEAMDAALATSVATSRAAVAAGRSRQGCESGSPLSRPARGPAPVARARCCGPRRPQSGSRT